MNKCRGMAIFPQKSSENKMTNVTQALVFSLKKKENSSNNHSKFPESVMMSETAAKPAQRPTIEDPLEWKPPFEPLPRKQPVCPESSRQQVLDASVALQSSLGALTTQSVTIHNLSAATGETGRRLGAQQTDGTKAPPTGSCTPPPAHTRLG